jgi:hypothetical protein
MFLRSVSGQDRTEITAWILRSVLGLVQNELHNSSEYKHSSQKQTLTTLSLDVLNKE